MSRHQGFVPGVGSSEGNLCLGLPIVRFSNIVLQGSPSNEFTMRLDLTALPQNTTILPGETWNFQAWFRDKNPTQTSNFTHGVAVTFF